MLERYGINLTKDKYKELVRQVQLNKSRPIYGLKEGKTVHLVKIEGKQIAVVYSRYQNNIVTILPPRPY
jgi:S-adenosylhomocysteine hydrolase